MELYNTLLKQLKSCPDYLTSEGNLKKWVVLHQAQNFEESLLTLLLEEKILKDKFFKKISGVMVFDQPLFTRFLEQKSFLTNSYTQYRNKVGLQVKGQYLKQQNEIALVWPFKDCVLEGGQSREEDQRKEVFFNEILAQEEITQLFEPKVLTQFKKYPESETEEYFNRNKKGTITDNLIIRGNNLLALHSLKQQFAEKVKLIYIDPPYNTGNDSFNYNDSFNQSTWLTFMKNRFEAAKTLLHPEGCIFVQCDDNEQAPLKILMDEVFGKENHRETIVVKTSTPSGVNAINVKRGERLFKVKEYLLFYSKNPQYRFHPLYVKSRFNKNYRYEVVKKNGKYQVTDLRKKGTTAKELEDYALKHHQNIYSLEKNNKKAGEKIKKVIAQSKKSKKVIEYTNSKNQQVLIYDGGVFIPLKDRIVKEGSQYFFGTLISDLWDDEIFQTNRTEGGVQLPSGKKPEKLLQRILKLTTTEKDLVLDYHLGSGTTAAVAHKMDRQYIGIEQLDYGENDATQRLKNVIQGDPTGISKNIKWTGGGSFLYFELKKHNQLFIEKITACRSSKKLLQIWEEMKALSFLNYHVDITAHQKHLSDFKALSLKEQKHHLFDLLDKNQLYVNLSSLQDQDFQCSPEEKQWTESFYHLEK